jgi:hypothetical protein
MATSNHIKRSSVFRWFFGKQKQLATDESMPAIDDKMDNLKSESDIRRWLEESKNAHTEHNVLIKEAAQSLRENSQYNQHTFEKDKTNHSMKHRQHKTNDQGKQKTGNVRNLKVGTKLTSYQSAFVSIPSDPQSAVRDLNVRVVAFATDTMTTISIASAAVHQAFAEHFSLTSICSSSRK